ncbi:hypothetical protein EI555_000006 [Monodon monoceros]|uniref:PTB-containing, cubilin and LRP1-interacting protein n=2 Tax=Odontoceti TaxID=9722 RepID=A0A4U1EIK3_MONMO|nr:hypothetical protein EI555_000006 [Monodon monoceros]
MSEQHFQTMLKSKLNVLTLKKEPLPAVIFHEPEAIELCTTTPLMKTRTHSGCKASVFDSLANDYAVAVNKVVFEMLYPVFFLLSVNEDNLKNYFELHIELDGSVFLSTICLLHGIAISFHDSGTFSITLALESLHYNMAFFGTSIQVTYLGKVPTTGMQFLSGCTEKPVIELWKKHTLAREDVFPANALLEIRPFQVWLHHLDHKGEATVHMDTFQVARIAYCTADHNVSPDIFAWVYREINDDLSYQMDCHAVECESKLEAKKLAHAMMEAFKKTFHSMKSDGRIHRNSSSEEVSQELESDDG